MTEGRQSGYAQCVARFMSLELWKGMRAGLEAMAWMSSSRSVQEAGEKSTKAASRATDIQSIEGGKGTHEEERGTGRRTQEKGGS